MDFAITFFTSRFIIQKSHKISSLDLEGLIHYFLLLFLNIVVCQRVWRPQDVCRKASLLVPCESWELNSADQRDNKHLYPLSHLVGCFYFVSRVV